MAKWKKLMVTAGGHNIIAKTRAKIGIDYTDMVIGDGVHSGNEDENISILNPKQSAEIKAVEIVGSNTVLIRAVLSNKNLTVGYWIREIGIYAVAADEPDKKVLFAVAIAEDGKADYWPEYEGAELRIPINISTATGDSSFVTASIVNTYAAHEIGYANTKSGLTAVNVQNALDEIDYNFDIFSSKFYRQAMSGNVKNYIDWSKEYPHIGYVRVQPLWFGANTVRILVIDDKCMTASEELIDCFQFYLDPNSSGLGNGVAPIGARVTVKPGTASLLRIYALIDYADGYTHAEGLEKALEHYIENYSSTLGTVDYDEISNQLLNLSSVKKVEKLLINEGIQSIYLLDDEIPVIQKITLEAV